MPPPPASGDLNSHSELLAWRSLSTSMTQVFRVPLCVRGDLLAHCACPWCRSSCSIRLPSLKFVGLPVPSRRNAAWWPWPLTFRPINGVTGHPCHGLPYCQFSACCAIPFSTIGMYIGQTDRQTDDGHQCIMPTVQGRWHNKIHRTHYRPIIDNGWAEQSYLSPVVELFCPASPPAETACRACGPLRWRDPLLRQTEPGLVVSSVTSVHRVRFAGGGVGGSTLPMIFWPAESPSIWAPGGSILTPVLVLHVSACGASTLSAVGDPPPNVFFLQIGHCPANGADLFFQPRSQHGTVDHLPSSLLNTQAAWRICAAVSVPLILNFYL